MDLNSFRQFSYRSFSDLLETSDYYDSDLPSPRARDVHDAHRCSRVSSVLALFRSRGYNLAPGLRYGSARTSSSISL